jgi:ppGpp synthetase/RelA/SpoT-type nucleotidyltranferase
MTKGEINKQRKALADFTDTSDYQQAVVAIRDILRQHLLHALGSDWEQIHYEYGLYTINCRVKRRERILDKFDKLAKDGSDIRLENFHRLMPDLVGGRLVAVDPGDLFTLAELVRNNFVPPKLSEPDQMFKKLRVRHGKFSMYDPEPFDKAGYSVELEDTGYCSVHFVYKVGDAFFDRFCELEKFAPVKRLDKRGHIPMSEWHIEVQVRTIMDEAWGEVDHYIRYEDPMLRDDANMIAHCTALAGYLQAANHHVRLIREAARRSKNART